VRAFILSLVIFWAAGLSSYSLAQEEKKEEEEAIAPDKVSEHAGEKVSVEGRVYSIGLTAAGYHIYFGADVSTSFQVLIPRDAVGKYQVDPKLRYDRRNLRVTGKILEESGKFYIEARDPKQIKIIPRKRKKKTT
jgi:hypothetical protein